VDDKCLFVDGFGLVSKSGPMSMTV